MCFSATGSFALAGLLTGVGGLSLARSSMPAPRMFAAVPLLFAAQQAAEGVVWRTLESPRPDGMHALAIQVFLAVALVVWPLWLPVSLRLIERDASRRRMLLWVIVVGALVAGCAAFLLVRWEPTASIVGHSIHYDYGTRHGLLSSALYLAIYAIPTVVPFFLSTARRARTIGTVLVISLVVAIAVERSALTSVWCFFAAVLSGLVLVSAREEERLASLA
jgi:hypothetical protein